MNCKLRERKSVEREVEEKRRSEGSKEEVKGVYIRNEGQRKVPIVQKNRRTLLNVKFYFYFIFDGKLLYNFI